MLKRDISSYQVTEIIQNLHNLQNSIDALNATINNREIDLVNSTEWMFNVGISYGYDIKNIIIKFLGNTNTNDFLDALQRLNNILNDLKHKMTFGNILLCSITFFIIGAILLSIASIFSFEYRRWRKRTMSKAKEMHNLETAEIERRLAELKKELMKANIQVSSGAGPSSPGKARQIKKNIARLLTVRRKKEVRYR